MLRKLNTIIAIVALSVSFYHFFIHPIDLSTVYIFAFLVFMFLLYGLEKVKEKGGDKKLGYGYMVTSLILLSGIIVEIFKSIY